MVYNMKNVKQIAEWIVSFIIAFFFVNLFCFAYERPVAWIDRTSGVTSGVRRPNAVLIHGTEGYGMTKLDANGFANVNKLLQEEYVLVMGSSHTQGKEVGTNKNFTTILNNYLVGSNSEKLAVYNVASDGNFLPSILKRFSAGIEEFDNAKTVVIEISKTDFLPEALAHASEQIHYNADETASKLFQNMDKKSKIKNVIKEWMPLVSLYKTKLETMSESSLSNGDKMYDTEEYDRVIHSTLELIRSVYEGNIIVLYHPNVQISRDGKLECVRSETINTFQNACEDNNIIFVDTGDAFVKYYNEYSMVPYGFANTTMGSGHLNEVGHKIIADELYKVLKEVE